jgi:hypothetical protein
MMDRHDNVRDALRAALAKMPVWVQASTEPAGAEGGEPAEQRRGEIKVHKDGTTRVVDVVRSSVPGRAAVC